MLQAAIVYLYSAGESLRCCLSGRVAAFWRICEMQTCRQWRIHRGGTPLPVGPTQLSGYAEDTQDFLPFHNFIPRQIVFKEILSRARGSGAAGPLRLWVLWVGARGGVT